MDESFSIGENDETHDHPETMFDTIDYWRPYFSPDSTLSINRFKLSDGSNLLCVTSDPFQPSGLRPILIIPGWFSMIDGWKEVVLHLSQITKVIYFESRDKGSSIVHKDKKTDMSIDRMAQDLQEIISQMELIFEETICIGSSLGGSILLHYLAHLTPLPSTTILVGPNPNFDLPPLIGRFLMALPLVFVGLAKRYVKWHILKFRLDPEKEPEQAAKYVAIFDQADNWKIKYSARQVTKFDAWDFLSDIKSKVILVGATKDKMHKSQRTLNIGKLIPDAYYVDFESNKEVHSVEFGRFVAGYLQGESSSKLTKIKTLS